VIDLSQQHCGVRTASFSRMIELMPDLRSVFHETPFPDFHSNYSWDVKVHLLMPRQYPCIPNWHTDNVPRENGIQRFERNTPEFPMWMWVSGAPLTQFKHGYVQAKKWHRFTQLDEHRGTYAGETCWRMFIRATHEKIRPPRDGDNLRRHSQVYLDADTYQW
jgi:hypothetical protein